MNTRKNREIYPVTKEAKKHMEKVDFGKRVYNKWYKEFWFWLQETLHS